MNNYDFEERRRQIEALLSYPNVGPLSAASIAVNLGTTEHQIHAALESLVQEERVIRWGGDRFANSIEKRATAAGAAAHGQLNLNVRDPS